MEGKALQIGDLSVRIPVIQGGMGIGVSLSGLAGAVTKAGGLGVISAAQIGYREADFAANPLQANLRALAEEIRKAKEIAAGGPIGVNIMAAMRHYEEYVRAAARAGADLIVSGAGLPVSLPGLVEGMKTKIAPIVSSQKAASVLLRMWEKKFRRMPDLVVIEGPEAGGHLGFSEEDAGTLTKETFEEEIRKILACVRTYEERYGQKIPAVIAGGMYERADLERAFSLGADGIQMATRFVTTYECDASDAYKETYLRAKKEDICLVRSPVGMPGRAIRNAFLEGEKREIRTCYGCLSHCNPREIPYCITDALVQAVTGNVEQGLLFCGTNAYRAGKLEHAADILAEFA